MTVQGLSPLLRVAAATATTTVAKALSTVRTQTDGCSHHQPRTARPNRVWAKCREPCKLTLRFRKPIAQTTHALLCMETWHVDWIGAALPEASLQVTYRWRQQPVMMIADAERTEADESKWELVEWLEAR